MSQGITSNSNIGRGGGGGLMGLTLGCNRLGDAGVAIVAEGLKADPPLQWLCVDSCGVGPDGAKALAGMLGENSNLLRLSMGFLKMTAALGEVPNRIGRDGACAIAEGLRHNRTLRILDLSANSIVYDGDHSGIDALYSSLKVPNPSNSTLVSLKIAQPGSPVDPLIVAGLKFVLSVNRSALSQQESDAVDEIKDPSHIKEIDSVYRLNGSYGGN